MAAFRRIKIFLLVIPALQFTAVTVQKPSPFAVKVGYGVNLPCKNVTDNSGKCDDITWTFSSSVNTVTLFEHGKIHDDAKAKSDKLSLSGDCSLQIKSTTAEDSGQYTCRQFNKPGQKHREDTVYVLSVVNGESTKTTTAKPTTTTTTNKSTSTSATRSTTTTAKSTEAQTNTTVSAVSDSPTESQVWWRVIMAVCLAALIITVVTVKTCKRSDDDTTQMDENIGLTSSPAETQTAPETSQDMTDPEDGVCYASITYTKKTKSKAQVPDKVDTDDDDQCSAVIYSTVKCSSSSAGASTDLSDLYATVNKLNK